MTEDRTVKYVGNGAYINGVPARDLTAEEYETHREAVEACPQKLYEVPKPKPAKAKKEDGE